MIQYSVSDGLCVLRLNWPPLNAITCSLLAELRAAICRANGEAEVAGIIIMGDAEHFSAGADVGLFREITSRADAIRISQVFQQAFQELEDSPKPVAAAVAGKVMGGALELAAACHFRVCSRQTGFSMPEVNLGINPGGGGTQRLPRLVGPQRALKMLLTAEAIAAAEALALGLVDEVCRPEELPARAGALLRSGTAPRKTSRCNEKVQHAGVNAAALREAEELLRGIRPEIIAPRMIAEAVKAGLEESFQAGLLKEQEGFARCMGTLATQNKIHLFFAAREAGKLPHLAAMPCAAVAKAGVVGMGTMGTGIVHALLAAGIPVVVRDEQPAALQRGVDRIRSSLQQRVAQGKLAPRRCDQMLSLICATTGWQELAGADLVIESVFEDVPAKQAVMRCLEEVCAAAAIIATNTSTISLDVLAQGMKRPERLIGMHFFNPAHRMPLVEIIRRDATPEHVIAAALRLAKAIGKTPVLVRNREGFLVSRLFVPYLKEAFWLLEEGADAAAIDGAAVDFGFPMGPLALIDMAGLDILMLTDRILTRAFPRHGPLSSVVVRLVEQGYLGQKAGAGVYKYQPGDYTPHHSEVTRRILAEVQQQEGRTPGKIGKDQIIERLVLRMVSEAFYVLEEGIAERESDLDVATVLGTGFPDFRGGVLKYARDLGLGCVLSRLQKLAESFGERFSPSGLLQETQGVR